MCSLVMGQSNMAAGATIGSNHNHEVQMVKLLPAWLLAGTLCKPETQFKICLLYHYGKR